MADEKSRKTSMRRVRNPKKDDQYVDVKVIDEITFFDAKTAQEFLFKFDNHEDADRKVHVVTVTGTKDDPDDPDSTVRVERIDEFGTLDPKSNSQEYRYYLTGNKEEPPVHRKTHKFKIHNKGGGSEQKDLWIEMQRVDELSVFDAKENGQERIFKLDWPDDDETKKDPVDSSSDKTSINPPWRFDPFQDVTDVHWDNDEKPKTYTEHWVIATNRSTVKYRNLDSNILTLMGPLGIANNWYFKNGPTEDLSKIPRVKPFPFATDYTVDSWGVIAIFSEDPNAPTMPGWPPGQYPQAESDAGRLNLATYTFPNIFMQDTRDTIAYIGHQFILRFGNTWTPVVVGVGTVSHFCEFCPFFIRGTAADAASVASAAGEWVEQTGPSKGHYLFDSDPAYLGAWFEDPPGTWFRAAGFNVDFPGTFAQHTNFYVLQVDPEPPPPDDENGGGGEGGGGGGPG